MASRHQTRHTRGLINTIIHIVNRRIITRPRVITISVLNRVIYSVRPRPISTFIRPRTPSLFRHNRRNKIRPVRVQLLNNRRIRMPLPKHTIKLHSPNPRQYLNRQSRRVNKESYAVNTTTITRRMPITFAYPAPDHRHNNRPHVLIQNIIQSRIRRRPRPPIINNL